MAATLMDQVEEGFLQIFIESSQLKVLCEPILQSNLLCGVTSIRKSIGALNNAHFAKNPQLQVHVSPEHVVVTRGRRSSEYKWKETLFVVMPGLTMTMDKAGLLLLSSPDKVTIGLLSWDGPGQGLRLLLRDTDRFSSHVDGILGRFYRGVLWGPPDATDDSKRTLRAHGFDFNATRKLKLDYQEGTPGTVISCWSVELYT
ncbi:inter-alpha-trypsin inhibitor heavy chain H4-like [Eptesicus fuscus]|uniref:inter-alpha-trypsin inhibitor heavy chain H4-like n=1 Tax=Eptesicus fuscus TaxID=29078 RepID=UPI0024048564|nr:inter-alpha-trypsin inhibitor heavy chain H4-like [Eptesicus fuscus]